MGGGTMLIIWGAKPAANPQPKYKKLKIIEPKSPIKQDKLTETAQTGKSHQKGPWKQTTTSQIPP